MQRQIIVTKDGSHSISIPEMEVTYHSLHGAIQESQHVFINAGLLGSGLFDYIGVHSILEIGLGTGLNALLTLMEADKHKNRIYYTSIEPYPLNQSEIAGLNYCEQLNAPQYQPQFERIHECGWEEMYEISEYFRLTKHKNSLQDFASNDLFDVIYFDAFAPRAQPELWTQEIFGKLSPLLKEDGVLVTYCSKSIVRKAMEAGGFKIEKIQGPWGKREMVRARRRVNAE